MMVTYTYIYYIILYSVSRDNNTTAGEARIDRADQVCAPSGAQSAGAPPDTDTARAPVYSQAICITVTAVYLTHRQLNSCCLFSCLLYNI